ncbi:hypothetical protein L3Q67_45135 (plasmid) [Saccharothrix sp. AJ9571]|nr:hypothetical protein L3Q67_45135 [Saccharothrix sp. AJ9571]
MTTQITQTVTVRPAAAAAEPEEARFGAGLVWLGIALAALGVYVFVPLGVVWQLGVVGVGIISSYRAARTFHDEGRAE